MHETQDVAKYVNFNFQSCLEVSYQCWTLSAQEKQAAPEKLPASSVPPPLPGKVQAVEFPLQPAA